jgi:hypothetical protein
VSIFCADDYLHAVVPEGAVAPETTGPRVVGIETNRFACRLAVAQIQIVAGLTRERNLRDVHERGLIGVDVRQAHPMQEKGVDVSQEPVSVLIVAC